MLIPLIMAHSGGTPTYNNPDEVDVSGSISGSVQAGCWFNSTTFELLTWSGSIGRVYRFETPISYRVGALTFSTTRTLTASVGGSPEFRGFDRYGSSYIACRDNGTGETNQIIEKYSSSGTAQHKLDTGITTDVKGVRMPSGTKLFYLASNVLYERTLSSSGDLTSAGSATSHTLSEVSTSQAADFTFNSDGSRLYVISSGTVKEYSMTSYNVGARSYVGSTSTSGLFLGTAGSIAAMTGSDVTIGSSELYRLEI